MALMMRPTFHHFGLVEIIHLSEIASNRSRRRLRSGQNQPNADYKLARCGAAWMSLSYPILLIAHRRRNATVQMNKNKNEMFIMPNDWTFHSTIHKRPILPACHQSIFLAVQSIDFKCFSSSQM